MGDTVSRKVLVDEVRINRIRNRVAAGASYGSIFYDLRDLLQEYDAVKQDYERAKSSVFMWGKAHDSSKAENERLRALSLANALELAEAKAENERLQQKLTDFEGCKGVEEYYSVLCDFREARAENNRLRAALENINFHAEKAALVDNLAAVRFKQHIKNISEKALSSPIKGDATYNPATQPGERCRHGIRYPHECEDCFEDLQKNWEGITEEGEPDV